MTRVDACDDCLRRTDLVAAIAGRLDVEWRRREAPARVLALPDEALLAFAGTCDVRRRYAEHRPGAARAEIERAGLRAVCRCRRGYPDRLRALSDAPALIHVAGDPAALAEPDAVAVVGARRATTYGLEVARGLGRGLSASGVSIVSGLALGIDAASHVGALEGRAPPVAVLACGADRTYPATKRRLRAEVAARGCVVSELPPGFTPMRWCFVARNRIIAALAEVLVVVEATERSGSLTTADFAAEIGRTVAAVPGRVTCRLAAGTNGLLQAGAPLVRDAADVLDLLADATGRPRRALASATERVQLEPHLRRLLDSVEAGRGTLGALAASPEEARAVLAGLGELEFRGLVRRSFGGCYERVP